MPHIIKNKNLEIHIDLPFEGYQLSRFDWTGKIIQVKFKNKTVSGVERTDVLSDIDFGKGFYNEFGIENPIGFDETEIGSCFHKIGVGLLKKTDNDYGFYKNYEIKPAIFRIEKNSKYIWFTCISEVTNGYGYVLKKSIELTDNGFVINYKLDNTGSRTIITDEYNHNFVSIDNDNIDKSYNLKFPFSLKPKLFKKTVNEEEKVLIFDKHIGFTSTPIKPFFFSDLTGSRITEASWELINSNKNLAIREQVDFKTSKINLWGWKHVISPEIFFKIILKQNDSVSWTRKYSISKIK